MPDHLRKQIRDAAKTALTGLATSGIRVFKSRTHELQDGDLPGLRIYTNDEDVEKLYGDGNNDGDEERALELVVECCSKKSTGFDDEIDAMVKEVEVAIAANQGMAGAKWVQLRRIEVDMEGEAEKEIGVARMTFEAVYYTALGAPDVAL